MTTASLTRRIAARPAIVYDALVTSDGIGSWWGPADVPAISAVADPRVGGHFRVRFRTDDGLEHECFGEFLELVPPERVVLTWRWVDNGTVEEQGKVSRVEFRLRPVDGATELTLVHSGLSSDESARGHEWGWDGAVQKLIRRFAPSARSAS